MGILYLVATPIGNLEDITLRALRILREVRVIAAEDTRHTAGLLRHYDIKTPLLSYHAFNARARRDRLLAELAQGDVALVSDAGTPGISDPGHDLVVAAIEAGYPVSAIPGPSSLLAAVTTSGLVEGPFIFLGFIARKGAERATALGKAAATGLPIVLFEASNRLADSLSQLVTTLGDRPAAVAREITKLHEEVRRGSLSELAEWAASAPPRGEIVIVIGGQDAAQSNETMTSDDETVLRSLLAAGLSVSQAAREAASVTGRSRSELYDLARRLKAESKGEPHT